MNNLRCRIERRSRGLRCSRWWTLCVGQGPRPNRAWGGLDANYVGTDEWLRFCERAKLVPVMGVGFGETTPDRAFTLREGECMGACGDAPVLLVNNKRMCVKMAPPALDALVEELREAAERGDGAPLASTPDQTEQA